MDVFLAWIVIVLPTFFALGIELVSKDIRQNHYWRYGVLAFGILLSGLTWLQIARASETAKAERDAAIVETSQKVSSSVSESVTKSVSKTLGDQYTSTINQLQGRIAVLETQLAAQGKKVDVISASNIVSGKNPIKVEVTNSVPSPSTESRLEIHASQMNVSPEVQYGKYGKQLILTTNKIMNGAKAQVRCKTKLKGGRAWVANSGMVMGGGRTIDEHTFVSSIISPNWAPDYPLVITLFTDENDLGPCDIQVVP